MIRETRVLYQNTLRTAWKERCFFESNPKASKQYSKRDISHALITDLAVRAEIHSYPWLRILDLFRSHYYEC
jgi:hypothetical protein